MTGVPLSPVVFEFPAAVVVEFEWIRESVGEEDPDECEEIVFCFLLSLSLEVPVDRRLPVVGVIRGEKKLCFSVEKNREENDCKYMLLTIIIRVTVVSVSLKRIP
jgi:hypothetical protein